MSDGILIGEAIYNLSALITEYGRSATIRQLTTLPGPQPYPNPPSGSGFAVDGARSIGDTSVSIRGVRINGRFIAGDQFFFGASPTVYTVSADTSSSGGAFTAVPFTPALTDALDDGTGVYVVYVADTALNVLLTSYPARLINNTTIQQDDLQIRWPVSALPYIPVATDKVFIGADQYSIIRPHTVELGGQTYAISCQIRK